MVVKNDRGERVLDTLVKADDPHLSIGSKNRQVYLFSLQRAPTFPQVQSYLREILKDRKIVGYHTEMKMEDLGLLSELSLDNLYDCSKMFNDNPRSG